MITLDQGLKREQAHPIMTDRAFGITLSLLFAFLSAWPVLFARPARMPFLWLSLSLCLIALGFPALLHWPRIVWMAVTTRVAKVVSFLLLGVIFFAVVTPVALFFRLIGRDALHRKSDPKATSYWVPRAVAEPGAPESMRYQF